MVVGGWRRRQQFRPVKAIIIGSLAGGREGREQRRRWRVEPENFPWKSARAQLVHSIKWKIAGLVRFLFNRMANRSASLPAWTPPAWTPARPFPSLWIIIVHEKIKTSGFYYGDWNGDRWVEKESYTPGNTRHVFYAPVHRRFMQIDRVSWQQEQQRYVRISLQHLDSLRNAINKGHTNLSIHPSIDRVAVAPPFRPFHARNVRPGDVGPR